MYQLDGRQHKANYRKIFMPRGINKQCNACSKIVFPKRNCVKPKCYNVLSCPKKRCYYRRIEHYRSKLRQYHRYIKFLDNKCFVCGSIKNLEAHHIEPQVLGGLDIECNIVTLCTVCHKVITIYNRRLGLERKLLA